MNPLLFIVTALIWGSTWLAIQFQLGEVMPLWSLTYRFGGAALILIIFCFFTKKNLRFNGRQHAWIALQALLVYSVSYVLFYMTSQYFVSGIVAVIFASIIIWNIINSRLFLKSTLNLKTIIGAAAGLGGLLCIMWAEISRLDNQDTWFLIEGLFLGCSGALITSLGQITTMANVRRGLPIIQTNALGYGYASIFMALTALLFGHPLAFDYSLSYVSSLLYLSLFGTVIAFLSYLTLIDRIGSDKGAYVFILTPIVALLLSSFYEGFPWSPLTIVGLLLIITGNILVMIKRHQPSHQLLNNEPKKPANTPVNQSMADNA